MYALGTIDLHNNSLDGLIPHFLGALPNLQELNLADNHFSGPIPTTLSQKNGLKLVVTGNPDLCASGKSCLTSNSPASSRNSSVNKKKNKTLPITLGITIPSFIIICAVVGVVVLLHYRRKSAAAAAHNPGQTGGDIEYGGRAVSPLMTGHRMTREDEGNLELAGQTNLQAYESHRDHRKSRY